MQVKTKRKIVRRIRRFQRFWREWGISFEEFEMLIGALAIVLFPLILSTLAVVIHDLIH